jgi:glycosyltransferase involved in cell wall biosynthesis
LDVIVVNDGSKDRTSEIAHDFERRYPEVFRVIDKPNGHYGSCINAALPVAAGVYVKILDADDTFNTSAFEHYIRDLETVVATTSPQAVFNDFIEVNETGMAIRKHNLSFTGNPEFTLAAFDGSWPFGNVWMHALAYKTDLLRKIDYRQTEGVLFSDQEWDTIPLAHARSFAYVPEPVYQYLIGREGQSVDPNIRYKSLWMYFPILKHIVTCLEYSRDSISPYAVSMVEANAKRLTTVLYYEYLIKRRTVLDESQLASFDRFTAEKSPWLHEFADTLIVSGRFFHCHFVRRWRHSGRIPKSCLMLLKMSQFERKLSSYIRKVCH